MITCDIAIIGGGPAGLAAAAAAGEAGARVLLIEQDPTVGGQLVKQTHRFFGSRAEGAGIRGFDLGRNLSEAVTELDTVTICPSSAAVGLYPDGRLLIESGQRVQLIEAERMVFATGASERGLLFPGNDLPGVYGAGAVQTLMNVHGVAPGDRVLMVGSGNIGLIVSYQLLQAGVEVVAVVEGLPVIGGYLVHAAKIRRQGVPILTRHTVVRADGADCVQSAVVSAVDDRWQPVPGTARELAIDVICLAVGLSPLCDLLWQAGCRMMYLPELGGHVPWHDRDQRTSLARVFTAGDCAGVEEASSALVTGELAGLTASCDLGFIDQEQWRQRSEQCRGVLERLRRGPGAGRIRAGRRAMREVAQQ